MNKHADPSHYQISREPLTMPCQLCSDVTVCVFLKTQSTETSERDRPATTSALTNFRTHGHATSDLESGAQPDTQLGAGMNAAIPIGTTLAAYRRRLSEQSSTERWWQPGPAGGADTHAPRGPRWLGSSPALTSHGLVRALAPLALPPSMRDNDAPFLFVRG